MRMFVCVCVRAWVRTDIREELLPYLPRASEYQVQLQALLGHAAILLITTLLDEDNPLDKVIRRGLTRVHTCEYTCTHTDTHTRTQTTTSHTQ